MYNDMIYTGENPYNIISRLKDKCIEISYVADNGKQTRSNTYFVCTVDKENVFVKETIFNHALQKLVPDGSQFSIPLEKIRVIGEEDHIYMFKKKSSMSKIK